MDNKELVDRLREALKYGGYNRMVADIIDTLSAPDLFDQDTMNLERPDEYRLKQTVKIDRHYPGEEEVGGNGMTLYKAETGSVYGPVYVVAGSFGEAEQLIHKSGRSIAQIEIVTSGSLLTAEDADHPDPGEEALSDVLQDRIDRAVEYAKRHNMSRLQSILTGEAMEWNTQR